MRFFITGANGYLGARLYQDIKREFEVYGSYHKEPLFKELIKLDMGNGSEIRKVLERIKPDIIIHAAALPTSKICDGDPELAQKINVDGTRLILDAANEIGAGFIYISTNGAAKPFDRYTRTKAEAEKLVEKSGKYLIIRPALVLGGSPNITNDRQQNRLIKNVLGTKPSVYDNSTKMQVTWIGQISEIILFAVKHNIWNEKISVSANEKKTRFEFSRDILKEFEINCEPTQDSLGDFVVQNSDKLKKLGLPFYSYDQVIEKTVKELKEQISSLKS